MFDGLDELRGFDERVVRTGIQPGIATTHDFDIELILLEVDLIDGGDFKFTARRRLAMGSLTETAIYSQWQHSALIELYYARWNIGEVDLVCLTASTQQPNRAVKIKWSDRPYQARSELDSCVDFVSRNPRMQQPVMVTSRTISDTSVVYKGVQFRFTPSSVYAYTLGGNILGRLNPADQTVTQHGLL